MERWAVADILTTPDRNSEVNPVHVQKPRPSPHQTLWCPAFLYPPRGAVVIFASILFSHPRQPVLSSVCPSRPPIALLHSLCLLPHSLSLSLPHIQLQLASTPPRFLSHLRLTRKGINEGVHVNLWWPRLRSFNQSGESHGRIVQNAEGGREKGRRGE